MSFLGRRTPFVSWPAGGGFSNVVPPAITGTVLPGYTLTVSDGTWTTVPIAVQYQWRNAGVNISGATSNTYTLVTGDIADDIDCLVTATNGINVVTAGSNVVNTGVPDNTWPYCPPSQPAGYWDAIAGTNWGNSSTTLVAKTQTINPRWAPIVMQDGRVFMPSNFGSASFQIYDPVSDTFTSTSPLFDSSANRRYWPVLLCDGRIFCMQSIASSGNICKGVIYDPVTDTLVDAAAGSPTWPTSTYNSPTFQGCLVMGDGRVFISPYGRSSNNNALIYDPAADTVVSVSGFASGDHQYVGCTLLRDGRVFVVPGAQANPRIYDPSTNTVTTATASYINESTLANRKYRGAVVVPDGRVALIPYFNQRVAYWDPVTDTASYGNGCWANTTWYGNGGCLLPDGKLWINAPSGTSTGSMHIYDPVTETFTSTATFSTSGISDGGGCLMNDGRVFVVYNTTLTSRIMGTPILGIPQARVLGQPMLSNS